MADATPVTVAPSLGHYLRPLRRQRRTMVAIVLIGVILGGLAADHVRPAFTAASRVLVQTDATDGNTASSTGRSSTATGPNMDTEAQLIKSTVVAERAAVLLKTDAKPSSLLAHVTITVPANTTILHIAYQAHSLPQAVAGANAFAQAYLANRTAASQAILNREIATAQAHLDTATRALAVATRKLDSLPSGSPAKHAELIVVNNDTAQSQNFTTILNDTQTTPITPGQVFTTATAAGSSPNQGRAIALLAGIVLGLLAAVAAAFYREWRVTTIRCEDDLERFGVRLIAEMPAKARGDKGGLAAAKARSRAEQRFASVVGGCLQRSGGTAYVASLSPAAAKGNVAERLSAELSRFGDTSEVVVYDPTSVTLVQRLAVAPAVEDVATAQIPVPPDDVAEIEATRATPTPVQKDAALGWPSLTVAPAELAEAGALPAPRAKGMAKTAKPPVFVESPADEPVVLSAEAGMLQHVAAARQRSQYVILDGPDPLANSEGYFLATLGDATALVVDAGVTTKQQLADVLDQIRVTGTTLLGAVLWRPVPGPASKGDSGKDIAGMTTPTAGLPTTQAARLSSSPNLLPRGEIATAELNGEPGALNDRAAALRSSSDSAP